MAKTTTMRVILESVSRTGADCEQGEDRTFSLSGYDEISYSHVSLAPAAADQALALIGDVTAVLILSLNGIPFSLRLDAAERLMTNITFFGAGFGDDATVAMLASADGSLLLTGDGANTADLLVVQLKAA